MKKFILKSIVYYLPVLLSCTLGVLATGDIGRMGGIPFGKYKPFVYPDNAYITKRMDLKDISQNKVVAIGDSYTIVLEHSWYIHYAQEKIHEGIRVVLLPQKFYSNPLASAYKLIQSGSLDSCKIILLQTCERYFINRLSDDFEGCNYTDIVSLLMEVSDTTNHPLISQSKARSQSLLERSMNSLRLILHLQDNPILQFHLDKSLFTHSFLGEKLFIYKEEIQYAQPDSIKISIAKENLIKLHDIATEHGLKLLFMVCANNYDLYQDYIINNPYPKTNTLDYFNDIDTCWFLNTKRIIKPHIDAGEKDLGLLNDTHWSLKSAKIAGEKLGEMIKEVLNDE